VTLKRALELWETHRPPSKADCSDFEAHATLRGILASYCELGKYLKAERLFDWLLLKMPDKYAPGVYLDLMAEDISAMRNASRDGGGGKR